jgi:uncharacterized damage-inducible protein DinB
MSVSAATVRTHIDYHAWATRRLMDAVGDLSHEEQGRDFGTADKSVLETLVHVYAADRLWLGRILGHPNPGFAGFITPADRSLAVLQNDWPALLERWKQWGAGLTEEGHWSRCVTPTSREGPGKNCCGRSCFTWSTTGRTIEVRSPVFCAPWAASRRGWI